MPATADLMATLGLDKSGFSSNIRAAQQEATDFGSLANKIGQQLAGIFAVGAVSSFITKQAAAAESIMATSHALGITAETFQALTKTADTNASSEERMSKALEKIQVKIGEARSGVDAAVKSFKELGLTQEQIEKLDMQTAIQAIADAWAAGAGNAETFATIQDILGKNAIELNSTFSIIAEKTLPGLTNEMRRAGDVLEQSTLRSFSKVDDTIDAATTRIKANLTNIVAGAIIGWTEMLRAAGLTDATSDFGFTDPAQRTTTPEERSRMSAAAWSEKVNARSAADDRQDAAMRRFEASQERAAQAEIKRMSALERVLYLEGRIAEIMRDTDNVSPDVAADRAVEILEIGKDLAEAKLQAEKEERASAQARHDLEQKIADVKLQTQARIAGIFGRETDPGAMRPVTELNRIGGFVGGMRDAKAEYQIGILRASEQSARLLQDVRNEIAALNRKTQTGPQPR